eukprot:6473530-Amphidinium_carterae.2
MSVASEMVLLVMGRLRGMLVNFIVGHAPFRDAPADDHAAFCGSFQQALRRVTPEFFVFVLQIPT